MSAPDPRDVIAAVLDDVGWINSRDAASEAIGALTAAGLRVVPEDRPAQEPTPVGWAWCVAHDAIRVADEAVCDVFDEDTYSACSFLPLYYFAGVPALDDDTRREVPEVLLTFAKWADWYLEDGCRRDHHGNCQAHGLDKDCPVGPMREWLAAYLGRTDG